MLFRDVLVGENFFSPSTGEFHQKISSEQSIVCHEDGTVYAPEDPIVFLFPEDHKVEEIEK